MTTAQTLDQLGGLASLAGVDELPIGAPGGPLEKMTMSQLVAYATGQLGTYPAKALGCAGDGVIDDTTAMTSALTAVAGKLLQAPDVYQLSAPVSMPPRTTIAGVDGNPSQPALGESVYNRFSLMKSSVVSSPAIIMNRGDVLRRGNLVYSGLPAAPTTPAMARSMVGAFAGTAINVVEADCLIEDYFIGGWETGVTVNPNNNVGSTARFRMRNVRMDTVNGILVNNQFDVAHICDVEMWPFLATDINGLVASDYVRDGYGLYLQGGFDSGLAEDVFVFGKTNSFVLDNVRAATLMNFLADSADGATSNQPTALTLKNNVWGHQIHNFRAESQWLGLNLDTTYTGYPTNPTATFHGGRVNSNNKTAVIQRGNYQFLGMTFGNSGPIAAVNVSANSGNLDFVLPTFESSTTVPFYFDPAYTGLCSIYLAEPQGPVAGFLGSSIPPSLITSGNITITGPSEQNIEQYVADRPYLQVGPQPRMDMLSEGAPVNKRRWSTTAGPDGSMADQLLSDDELTVVGVGSGRRLFQNGGQSYIVESADLRPPFDNVADAKSAGMNVKEFYYDTTLGRDVQIRS